MFKYALVYFVIFIMQTANEIICNFLDWVKNILVGRFNEMVFGLAFIGADVAFYATHTCRFGWVSNVLLFYCPMCLFFGV